MTTFIRLTDPSGNPALVAVEEIIFMTKDLSTGKTMIVLSGYDQEMEVQEDKALIVAAIAKAGYNVITP